jgi:hypothetical protein
VRDVFALNSVWPCWRLRRPRPTSAAIRLCLFLVGCCRHRVTDVPVFPAMRFLINHPPRDETAKLPAPNSGTASLRATLVVLRASFCTVFLRAIHFAQRLHRRLIGLGCHDADPGRIGPSAWVAAVLLTPTISPTNRPSTAILAGRSIQLSFARRSTRSLRSA